MIIKFTVTEYESKVSVKIESGIDRDFTIEELIRSCEAIKLTVDEKIQEIMENKNE